MLSASLLRGTIVTFPQNYEGLTGECIVGSSSSQNLDRSAKILEVCVKYKLYVASSF